eukprot:4096576-Pleurochrysis_carterae.AAC.2
MTYKWGHPVATLPRPSDERDYTLLLPMRSWCFGVRNASAHVPRGGCRLPQNPMTECVPIIHSWVRSPAQQSDLEFNISAVAVDEALKRVPGGSPAEPEAQRPASKLQGVHPFIHFRQTSHSTRREVTARLRSHGPRVLVGNKEAQATSDNCENAFYSGKSFLCLMLRVPPGLMIPKRCNSNARLQTPCANTAWFAKGAFASTTDELYALVRMPDKSGIGATATPLT